MKKHDYFYNSRNINNVQEENSELLLKVLRS
jgi:hypothetical protein